MGARQKLNTVYFSAYSIVAAVIGLAFQSWALFAIALIAGMAMKAYDGGIRPRTQKRRRPRR